jgi:hypothetical protein
MVTKKIEKITGKNKLEKPAFEFPKPTLKEFARNLRVGNEFVDAVADMLKPWHRSHYTNILVVVDTAIKFDPSDDFGISSVIELIRGAEVGCMRFRVDIALRNGEAPSVVASPTIHEAKYRGFRFDMDESGTSVIDKYQQIWCFGFKPSNSGDADDAEIDFAASFPSSAVELAKLAIWMKDNKGGLFGTGDHHFLGASMCRKIPRLGTMRRWTNTDGVPPQGRANLPNPHMRIDTLRPPSAAFEPSAPGGPANLDNGSHQGDLTVQPIQWTAHQRRFWPFIWTRRPHPVLCHPTLGPINVMPDHAHEGLCVEVADINLAATYNFDGAGDQDEYPDALDGSAKPVPFMAAYGSNLGSPPYSFSKGAQPARSQNPMINVYDGHRAGVGRVATDSTWHHWMDVNINEIRAANNDDWKKISRYFINLAVWLNPPGFSTHCFYLATVVSHFQTPGFQEYFPKSSVRDLGQSLRSHLIHYYGPCWVTDRIWDIIWQRKLWPFELLREELPSIDFGGVDPNILEELVLGHMVQATIKSAQTVKDAVSQGNLKNIETLQEPEKLFDKPVRAALKELTSGLEEHFALGTKVTKMMN